MFEEPLILSIETATLSGSVVLCRNELLLASLAGDSERSHSNTLLIEIDEVLTIGGCKLVDIDVFAVSTGPGSFTGLRIGIATVKGLAFTLQRPCVGIPTLEAIAHSARVCGRVVAVLPAGRGEVFVQMFSVATDTITPLDAAKHISPNLMLNRYDQFEEISWCGEGAQVHRALIAEAAERTGRALMEETDSAMRQPGWRLIARRTNLAESVAELALRRIRANYLTAAEKLQAVYVRPSDAELNEQTA